MGYPAFDMKEKMIRNDINEVVKFLELKHNGHYKIYNLCKEREDKMYDKAVFQNRSVSKLCHP